MELDSTWQALRQTLHRASHSDADTKDVLELVLREVSGVWLGWEEDLDRLTAFGLDG